MAKQIKPDTKFDLIDYNPKYFGKPRDTKKSIEVFGIDTEAYTDGQCYMIATSEGDVYTPETFLLALFGRKYRNKIFVAYNLKYEISAFLQGLQRETLKQLRETGKAEENGYRYEVIANKKLVIRRDRYRVTFYDILQFYNTSLRKASETYLSERKYESEVNDYTKEYVRKNYAAIRRYCIQDARLAKLLAQKVIHTFEGFGGPVRSLVSTASVSWAYFRRKCEYEHVKWFWDNTPVLLRYAQEAYRGGKFEITMRGMAKLYEYDIVSAYPYEIANLKSIQNANVYYNDHYHDDCDYGYYDVTVYIPPDLFSPIGRKLHGTVVYPSGIFRTFITLSEYRWLLANNVKHDLHSCVEVFCKDEIYPYREEIHRLADLKDHYKRHGAKMEYQAVKILMNSLYGKFAQLIPINDRLKAGDSWNPIFASEITARTRIRVTDMQNKYKDIIAVHTDSVISTKPLDIRTGRALGDWEHTISGRGLMFGCGIYQIGDKSRFRGFTTKEPLLSLMPTSGNTWDMSSFRPHSWREVIFRDMPLEEINHFVQENKSIDIRLDRKRLWIDDWKDYAEVRNRKSFSMPHLCT
jgi:hypothetical protein